MEPLRSGDPQGVGRYRFLGRLGAGGMGLVCLGRGPDGRLVAVKLIHEDIAADPDYRRRFAREVRAAAAVQARFTAAVVDADPQAPQPWYASEFIDGPTLGQIVRRTGPLEERALRALAAGLAEAVAAFETAGLVHRDLKPDNILLAADGPKVIDFGIARGENDSLLTRAGSVLGSPGYMSPEQIAGDRVTSASDVFSLGAVLAFAGQAAGAFGDGPAEARIYMTKFGDPDISGIPLPLRDPLLRCLAKKPRDRPTPRELVTWWSVRTDELGTLINIGRGPGAQSAESVRPTGERLYGAPAAGTGGSGGSAPPSSSGGLVGGQHGQAGVSGPGAAPLSAVPPSSGGLVGGQHSQAGVAAAGPVSGPMVGGGGGGATPGSPVPASAAQHSQAPWQPSGLVPATPASPAVPAAPVVPAVPAPPAVPVAPGSRVYGEPTAVASADDLDLAAPPSPSAEPWLPPTPWLPGSDEVSLALPADPGADGRLDSRLATMAGASSAPPLAPVPLGNPFIAREWTPAPKPHQPQRPRPWWRQLVGVDRLPGGVFRDLLAGLAAAGILALFSFPEPSTVLAVAFAATALALGFVLGGRRSALAVAAYSGAALGGVKILPGKLAASTHDPSLAFVLQIAVLLLAAGGIARVAGLARRPVLGFAVAFAGYIASQAAAVLWVANRTGVDFLTAWRAGTEGLLIYRDAGIAAACAAAVGFLALVGSSQAAVGVDGPYRATGEHR
ncbi:hypothetical protein GCM10009838_42360 [Catenulispora subtropica]|uniref:Protein kinase domain-containing protein n=2 Tax=Catenulispora subtropica TaxID=450798 RepID=A0ABP5DEP3_9ACTN